MNEGVASITCLPFFFVSHKCNVSVARTLHPRRSLLKTPRERMYFWDNNDSESRLRRRPPVLAVTLRFSLVHDFFPIVGLSGPSTVLEALRLDE